MIVDQFSQMIGLSNDRSNLLAVTDNLGKMMLSNQVKYNRGGGTLVCGSPNEVESDPTLDDFFDTQEADLDCIGCLNTYGNYHAQVSDANPCSFVLTFRLHIVSNRCLLTSLSNLYAETICLDYECT